mmetsp:Transcript_79532/g.137971  ORF Transcript_79532/g.137971 Transcript_79532/m.137971 type:complete len:113 (-) Transcript_79532:1636-1974(-)
MSNHMKSSHEREALGTTMTPPLHTHVHKSTVPLCEATHRVHRHAVSWRFARKATARATWTSIRHEVVRFGARSVEPAALPMVMVAMCIDHFAVSKAAPAEFVSASHACHVVT